MYSFTGLVFIGSDQCGGHVYVLSGVLFNTAEYKTYEDVTRNFPATEFDVLVVVEGPTLLDRSSLEKLRDLVIDLQLIDGTRGVISLFSARQPPENGQIPAALFPIPCRRAPNTRTLLSG